LDIPVWASYPITVLWIVGLTNAFNLIDGSDGIAAGAALFAAICMAVVFALNGSQIGSAISIALAGATLGFLFFNFPPASIFLGDSGSLLLGFTLALLGILTTQEASMTLAVAIPVLSLGFPLLDTGLTIGRRFLRRQPIFASDRAHIHHRLRDLGHTPRGVAFVLYGACAVFSLIALLMLSPAKAYAPVVFVALGTALWLAVQRLRLPELLEVQRVARRVMRQRDVIAHNIRLREALSSIRRAQSPKEILDALCLACIGGDFERMELSMVTPDGEVLSGQHGVVSTKNGCQWIWEKPNAVPLNQRSELRTPILTADGRTVGRLSVWCSFANHFFLTDIHLLAVEFQPEIHAALGRVQNLAAVRAAEAASTRPAEPQAQVLPSLEKLA
jgi:hypothetical protein